MLSSHSYDDMYQTRLHHPPSAHRRSLQAKKNTRSANRNFLQGREPDKLPLTAVLSWLSWLVAEDALDLFKDGGGELLSDLDGLDVILDLLNLSGAENNGADIGVLEGPGEGKGGSVGAEAFGNGGQLLNLLDLGLALGSLKCLDSVLKEAPVVGEARPLGDTVVILASQQTGGEWGPDGGAIAVTVEERRVLDLKAFAVESVVLGLLNDGGDEVVALSDLRGLLDLDSGPLGGAPVVGQVEVTNNLGEAFDNLAHGGGIVRAVGENDVDVRLLQTGQGALETLDDVLPAETAGVGLLATGAEKDLGGQDVLVAGPVELLQGLAHLNLGVAIGIRLGGIEGVNAVLPSGLQTLLDDSSLLGTTVGEPTAEGQSAHLEPSGAQVAELHVLGVESGSDRHGGGGGG